MARCKQTARRETVADREKRLSAPRPETERVRSLRSYKRPASEEYVAPIQSSEEKPLPPHKRPDVDAAPELTPP